MTRIIDEILTKKIVSDNWTMLHKHIISRQERIEHKGYLQEKNPAKLWLTFIEMVNIVSKITKAWATGNWRLHLETISECLAYLASIGRYLYANSTYLYLQCMNKLFSTNPDVYQILQGRLYCNLCLDIHIKEQTWLST